MRSWRETKAGIRKARSELAALKRGKQISNTDWRCLHGYLQRLDEGIRTDSASLYDIEGWLDTLEQGIRLVRANGQLNWYGPD